MGTKIVGRIGHVGLDLKFAYDLVNLVPKDAGTCDTNFTGDLRIGQRVFVDQSLSLDDNGLALWIFLVDCRRKICSGSAHKRLCGLDFRGNLADKVVVRTLL